jgi:hypothetical protein
MELSEREQNRLNKLSRSILSSWGERHEQIPNVLYHYTSADGLIGILTSKSIWLTDLRYMNDLSELQYSRELVGRRLAARAETTSLIELQREFIRRVSTSFDPFSLGNSVFSASFCEDGNLLSQWRAYRGRGGGYAIGFDFFHLLRLLSRPCVLRRIIYDEKEQTRLIDSVIDAFVETLQAEAEGRPSEEVASGFLPHLCHTFSLVIGEFLFSFKHPDFREEQEWRLVHFANVDPTSNRGSDVPKFRSYDGNVIPFFAVDFEQAILLSRDDTHGYPFPIVDLTIGPTINADLNQESTKLLLLSLNPDICPNIRRSGIPLRWL